MIAEPVHAGGDDGRRVTAIGQPVQLVDVAGEQIESVVFAGLGADFGNVGRR